ncbi:MAG TPA: PKD domain-containing protein, partial [Saprospiraceae bacterium]|nr:PKD domain-containing protein [Saprospiraceae bacterium]
GFEMGSVITISWHLNNPLNGGSAWDPDPKTVESILPGGEKHDVYKEWLDKVAAFVNGECRGVSPLYEVSALGQNMANLFIYGNPGDGEVEIRIYDASEDRIYLNVEDFNFASNGLIGNFGEPYTFENKVFSASFVVEHTACSADNNGAATVSLVTSLEPPYTYAWSNGASEATATGLAAGDYEVTITGQGGLWFIDTVSVENQMLEITEPELTASFDGPVCRGNDAVFYASGSLDGAIYRWSDGAGNYVHEGEALLFENMQDGFSGYLQADYHGCFSAPIPVVAEVYQPDAGFYATPSEAITTETEVSFEPAQSGQGYSYHWDFGDGTSSTEQSPKHQYNLPGLYTASLALADASGCSATESYGLLVESVTNTLELPDGAMVLEATPNPFSQLLRVKTEVPGAGAYTLRLLSMDGKLVWEQGYDWPSGSNQVEVELSIADAVYLLQLDDGGGGQIIIPVVKQTPRP